MSANWEDFSALISAGADPLETLAHTSQVFDTIHQSVHNVCRPRRQSSVEQAEQRTHPVTALWHQLRLDKTSSEVPIPFIHIPPRIWRIHSAKERLDKADNDDDNDDVNKNDYDNDGDRHNLHEKSVNNKNNGLEFLSDCAFDEENKIDLLSMFPVLSTKHPLPASACFQRLSTPSKNDQVAMSLSLIHI